MTATEREDRGSITPLILVFFLIAALLVMGTTSAGSAFLAQRDLQSVCDGAAVRATGAVDEGGAYHGPADLAALPLSDASVQAAVGDYQSQGYPTDSTLSMSASTDGQQVTVVCHRVVTIPFGAVFGKPTGLERTAASTARAPLRE
jgi:uncharacterized membrane protein